MQARKVLSVIAVLIVIVYAISGIKNIQKNKNTTDENGQTQVVDYSQLTNQLVYNGQNIDVQVVDMNGVYYFPVLELAEKLNYKVNIGTDGRTTISDGKNTTVIKSDVAVFINGEEHAKVDNFQPVTNYLAPLDFVRVVFGVEFTYDIDQENNIKYFYMTGRNIYEVSQTDVKSPHLYVYTQEGLRDLGVISNKADIVADDTFPLTEIESVVRTDNSDIITTNYTNSGALTSEYPNILYVRNGSLIDNTNLKTTSYVVSDGLSTAPTISYDNRVAFLNRDENGKTVIKIYDDSTGNLVSEIDTVNQYGSDIYNIQAVAKDFLVVGMYGQLYEDTYSTYYTAVINLNTNEVIPMYEKFGQAQKLKEAGMQDNVLPTLESGLVPFDNIVFNFVADDGSLKFTVNDLGDDFGDFTTESVNVTLSK